ncbi:EGF-like repeat and discoidin I-like domain-containing protein 3 [Corticium candelabrum]|uniref:EGF-like repeat and discoidin I-like domain-containing protein 3 n=1 Tax=Corticium candelabrum TaxID=121492 RepID=UPI002E26D82A|nr:EGF-like repeat and discoidin I-like domain-containing protein 3 [Corticium candelabrum]
MALFALLFALLAAWSSLKASDAHDEHGPPVQVLANAILGHSALSYHEDVPAKGTICDAPLGLSSGFISSSQISSTVPYDVHHDINGVRLLRTVHPVFAYCTKVNDVNQWVQVDFKKQMKVTGVATQGRYKFEQWVRRYSISYSSDGQTWLPYEEDGETKVFQGNGDQNGVVKNNFALPVFTRYIRFNPKVWFGHICFRLEFYGCQDVCNSGLGMVSGALDSSRLAASSIFNDIHDERGSRLLTTTNGARSLSTLHVNTDQYLQVDVGLVTTVTAVATQGRDALDQWIKTYSLSHSKDGSTWFAYKENGQEKVFSGNSDFRQVVTHHLSVPITARYIRFHPKTWKVHISFRVEVFGCPRECDFPLGMTTGVLDSYHVTSSSDHDFNHDPRSARLLTDTLVGSWSSKQLDVFQWLQVDFGSLRKVTAVATQGRLWLDQWVTSYHVSFSNDGQSWTLYHEAGKETPEVFQGNTDRDEVTKSGFYPPVIAKFARVLPQTWVGHISMRVEFYGCRI